MFYKFLLSPASASAVDPDALGIHCALVQVKLVYHSFIDWFRDENMI
jgi:hypothetical protein